MLALVLLQLIKWNDLVSLSDADLARVNTRLETEILSNDIVKRELSNKAKELTQNFGQGGSSSY